MICLECMLTDCEHTKSKPLRLTDRQIELARLVAEGHANKEIGYRLGITEGSVKVCLSHVFARLGLDSRLKLALWVHQQAHLVGGAVDVIAVQPRRRASQRRLRTPKGGTREPAVYNGVLTLPTCQAPGPHK